MVEDAVRSTIEKNMIAKTFFSSILILC